MTKDDKLESLVNEIFKIIPSYYDERQASKIAELINAYAESIVEQRH